MGGGQIFFPVKLVFHDLYTNVPNCSMSIEFDMMPDYEGIRVGLSSWAGPGVVLALLSIYAGSGLSWPKPLEGPSLSRPLPYPRGPG